MPSSLHAQLIRRASKQGVSLNLLLNTILAEYVGGGGARIALEDMLPELTGVVAELRSAARSSGGLYETTSSRNLPWSEVAEPSAKRS